MKANTCYNTGWLLLWLRFYDLFVKYLIGTALNVPFQIGRKGGSVIFFRFAVVAVSIECLWKLNPWLWSSISDRTECWTPKFLFMPFQAAQASASWVSTSYLCFFFFFKITSECTVMHKRHSTQSNNSLAWQDGLAWSLPSFTSWVWSQEAAVWWKKTIDSSKLSSNLLMCTTGCMCVCTQACACVHKHVHAYSCAHTHTINVVKTKNK